MTYQNGTKGTQKQLSGYTLRRQIEAEAINFPANPIQAQDWLY